MDDLGLLLPITALLPITSVLLVVQRDPHQTLVLRGVLGAVASLIYALMGAADVALTEALVGTLLATTLYVVALNSSMVVRLGVAAEEPLAADGERALRSWLEPAHLRLEMVPLPATPADPNARPWLHGVVRNGNDLRFRTEALQQRMLALESARHWRDWGGAVGLEAPPPS